KHPMASWLGMKVPDQLNPDQGNDEEVKREAMSAVFFAIIFDGLGESAEGGNVAAKERVFWSGGDVAKNAALDFAKANGMKTLEMTIMGRFMNSVSPYLPKWLTRPIW